MSKKYPDLKIIGDNEYSGDLHVTIMWFKDLMIGEIDWIHEVLEWFTSTGKPISGRVNGSLVFENDDERPFCAIFDSKDIFNFRVLIEGALEQYGVKTQSEHGFIPHITLQYLKEGDALPVNPILQHEIVADEVCLIIDDSKKEYFKFPLFPING